MSSPEFRGRIAEAIAEGTLDRELGHTGDRCPLLEAEALRVEALAASGDTTRADLAADAFLARHPESPYTQRVRSATRR